MHFEERIEGDFKIFTGAMEATGGDGYTAAVVVEYLREPSGRIAFHDDNLAGGHRWSSYKDALAFAMRRGLEALSTSVPAPEVDAEALKT